ncbi:MAG: PEGA domain-containing protein [Deltaproteobacteria bacterium]|nr:PEGA domain-containing protein [Deltaproteobacteria bacterium]
MTTSNGVFSFSRLCSALLVSLALTGASGCTHVVTIESEPPGAKVTLDGEDKGNTPVVFEEQTGFFDSKKIKVELDGYLPVETELEQSEVYWPMAAPSLCLAPVTGFTSLLGCMGSTKYAEYYTYEMSPAAEVGDGSFVGGNHGKEEPVIDDPAASVPF